MVAYSFQKRFEPPILAKTKLQTIRGERRRHARPHEIVSLYVGMRTKSCRLIDHVRCVSVDRIELDWVGSSILIGQAARESDPVQLDGFAVLDGFKHWADMAAFWRKHHPKLTVFRGVLIRWQALTG